MSVNPNSATINQHEIETLTQQRGQKLLQELQRQERRMGSDWLYGRLMRLTTSDEALKVQLFRFVDALPSLQTTHAIAHHLLEFLDQPDLKLPRGTRRLLSVLGHHAATEWIVADTAQLGAKLMARRFIAGENAQLATHAVERLRRGNMAFSLDLLGEAVTSENEALAYQQKYLNLIRELSTIADRWDANPQTDETPFGSVPRVNVSVKLSSLYARFDPMAAESTVAAVKERLRPLLSLARERGAFINFDMEQYDYCAITRRIFEEVLTEDAYRDWPDVGIVTQAYLPDAAASLEELLDWVKQRSTPIWVRLVKGAYWDYETIMAAQRGYPLPVFAHKAETDANYERLTEMLLTNWQLLRPAIATHNARSASHAQAVAESLGLPARAVEYQVLFGMGESIGRSLAAQDERVRVYVPFGELLPGMAYLVRRLLENTSNDSFIRHIEQDDFSAQQLLVPPVVESSAGLAPSSNHGLTDNDRLEEGASPACLGQFQNEPVTDFALPEQQESMWQALSAVESQLGATVPIVINGQRETSLTLWDRPDPSQTARIVARAYWATTEQATRAVMAAQDAFPTWRAMTVAERAMVLRRVAAEFHRRRFEISAWQVHEVGKPWRDADADVAEAIDFCEYYALEMERLQTPHERNVPGEWNEYIYDARGPAVIIAPWNFPLAILTGMTVAALVAGNTVVIKPSEQASRTGYFLMEALEAAGIPPGVVGFLPGEGETIGPALVNDPRVTLIAFTGSREVGLSIMQSATAIQSGQREIKRVIAELGGKNAIIVDEDADLDEAVLGVLASTVGYSGQKCSACSRAIIVGSAYEPFCARLADAIKSIQIGSASDPATTLGPMIDETAQQRVLEYTRLGSQEGEILAQTFLSDELKSQGYFVPATVFTNCPAEGKIWQEEIFGPILAVRHAPDLSEALALADDSLYALTGGFYSRSPANIERVRREFRVGNLYINRKITGALVDRQPFGGLRLSGIGSKAGGPDYLLQFLVPRTITESVMRRGFAPSARLKH